MIFLTKCWRGWLILLVWYTSGSLGPSGQSPDPGFVHLWFILRSAVFQPYLVFTFCFDSEMSGPDRIPWSADKATFIQYHSFIWKRLFLDTWQHHRVMPLNTQLIAIEMNPKPFLLSQIIHLFQNCLHLKKIVTFPYNFGHHKHFPPKFQILVV